MKLQLQNQNFSNNNKIETSICQLNETLTNEFLINSILKLKESASINFYAPLNIPFLSGRTISIQKTQQ